VEPDKAGGCTAAHYQRSKKDVKRKIEECKIEEVLQEVTEPKLSQADHRQIIHHGKFTAMQWST
jgi:hypothetical protein